MQLRSEWKFLTCNFTCKNSGLAVFRRVLRQSPTLFKLLEVHTVEVWVSSPNRPTIPVFM